MDNQDPSLAMACVELAKLIANDEKDKRPVSGMDDPRVYWLTLVAECREALSGRTRSNP